MNTKERLIRILREHYFFEDHELEDFSLGKKMKELDIDSIALLELFLIIEEGFNLKGKVSDRLDMNELGEKSVDEFLDAVSFEVEAILAS